MNVNQTCSFDYIYGTKIATLIINSDKKVVSLTTGVILTDVRVIQNVSESDGRIVAYAILFIFLLLFIIALLLGYIKRLQTRELF